LEVTKTGTKHTITKKGRKKEVQNVKTRKMKYRSNEKKGIEKGKSEGKGEKKKKNSLRIAGRKMKKGGGEKGRKKFGLDR